MYQLLKSNIFLLIFLPVLLAGCRSAEADGVYGGRIVSTDLINSSHHGREMVLLLRPDGTFTDDLRARDWKSEVKGKYVVTGSTLKLVYIEKNKVDEYKINLKGHLSREGAIFLKMDKSDTVPEGVYDFKGTQRSGGPATGQLYVGNNVHASYYFDGRGNFIDSGTGKTRTSGNYQLHNGELTLNFQNRKTEKHIFFARKEAGKIAAVIDGRFYFSGDLLKDSLPEASKDEDKNNKDAPGSGAKNDVQAAGDTMQVTALPPVEQVLDSLRTRYGGSAIDEIKTVYTEASSVGFDIFSFADFSRGRVRFELYQDDKLVAVEQLEGKSGWRWMQGTITTLEPDRVDEIIFSQHMGIMGLKKNVSADLLTGTIESAKHGYNLSFQIGGRQFIYVIDKDFNLLGDAYRIGDIEQASQYNNFKNIDGVSVPFTTEIFRDGQKSTLTIDKFIINQPLKTKWNKPPLEK